MRASNVWERGTRRSSLTTNHFSQTRHSLIEHIALREQGDDDVSLAVEVEEVGWVDCDAVVGDEVEDGFLVARRARNPDDGVPAAFDGQDPRCFRKRRSEGLQVVACAGADGGADPR